LAIKTYSRKDRNEAVEELLKKVEAGTKAVYESERYKEMLICMAKFHSYSANNIILITSVPTLLWYAATKAGIKNLTL
jgi:hypothetical protein